MGELNTLQLTLALSKYPQTANQFIGVFARDELPLLINVVFCFRRTKLAIKF